MKRLSFFIMICLLTSFGAGAVDTIVDGIKYSLDVEHKTAEVIQNTYTGDIVIPAAIDYEGENYNVTSIGYAAFYLSTIRSIVIPYGVTEIGGGAFAGCDYLERVSLPEGIKTIKENTFDHCKSLTSIYLPQSLTTIEQKAFAWSGLESITIPNGVTVIEPYTFIWCSSFSCIDLPETLKSIDGRAFWWCHLLSVTCRALEVPEVIESGEFIYPNSTLIVPATSIEAYKSAEGWGSFGTVEPITPHHPFVEAGKLWRVHGFNMGSAHRVTDYYFSDDDEAETIDGHTYLKMYAKTGEETTLVGLFREINQRVYKYDVNSQREYAVYDFSLDVGDSFYLESDKLYLKVLRTGEKTSKGETLKALHLSGSTDDNKKVELDWIEGIGNVSSPVAGFDTNNDPNSWGEYVAYAVGSSYLPLSFAVNWNGWWGQDLSRGKELEEIPEEIKTGKNDLHYEIVPDPAHDAYALHVYGIMWFQNTGPSYIYCRREYVSDFNYKLYFNQEFPCGGFAAIVARPVDIYFYFFSPGTYTAIDESGEYQVTYSETPLIRDDYRPFIEEGKVWKVGRFNMPYDTVAYELDTYYFAGDTIVGGHLCKKMMCRYDYSDKGLEWGGIPRIDYEGALYEKDCKVYLAYPNSDVFVLIYDFISAEDFEVSYFDTEAKKESICLIGRKRENKDSIFHGMDTEIYIKLNQNWEYTNSYGIHWREGVGYNGLHNTYELISSNYGTKKLMSCIVSDEVLYYDATLTDGTITHDDPSEVKKNWLDFTHTVKTKPKAPGRAESAETTSDEETVTGEYSVKELFVNFKTLAGTYTITVTDAAGDIIYNKVVQTSNVVALNTDISSYPKGEYTITVENEEEMYTAEFNFDEEDGLTPNPSPVGEGNYVGAGEAGAVYDLSGRRIVNSKSETLPLGGVGGGLSKGIYIINGRKVVVK